MVQIASTPPLSNSQVEFQKNQFDELIWKKGYEVTIEKAVKCPCHSKGGHQRSNCRNCGGSGWLFINPTKDRMVMTSANLQTKFREWSEESMGTVNISALSRTELTFMDKITVDSAHNIFNEVVFPQESDKVGNRMFSFLTYDIVEIQYAGMFVNSDQKIQVLVEGTDFQIQNGNVLIFEDHIKIAGGETPSIAFRYKHRAQYHILDVNREFMTSWNMVKGKETEIRLPISAVAQRAHFKLDKDNMDNSYLIDNTTSTYLMVDQ